ncbi:MAG: Uma2 family endonuclease [Phycisphaerales bacterium]|nr:MAG: Uma2 family endonuclease [Phycisphaerales bacterium]
MATATTTRLTAEEFERQFADVDSCELERGEVVRLTAGEWRHSSTCFKVAFLLGDWARTKRTGRVLINEAGLVTSRDPDTVRGVDVAYFSFERVPRGQEPESFVEVPPNLAVEVLGKGQGWKKMAEKVGEYLRIRADRTWIIDPRHRTLHVFSPEDPPRAYAENETVTDEAVLPGFSCRVAEFFGDQD